MTRAKVSAQRIREVFGLYAERLSAGDIDGIVELFAEDATLEDPIGSPVQRGSAAIRRFYEASKGATTLRLEGRVRTASNEGACAMIATPNGTSGVYIDTLDVMSFDDAGRVTSMRAYWSPDTIRREG